MKVKLIQVTQNPIDVMWTAARTCYSEKSPVEIWDDRECTPRDLELLDNYTEKDCEKVAKAHKRGVEKHWNLVQKVLSSGHQSIAEHVYFTFAIEGISRACSHQLVRHRAGIVFSQQSQRYVEIKESYEKIRDLVISIDPLSEYFNECTCEKEEQGLIEILNKYFVDVNEDNVIGYGQALMHYLRKTDCGEKAEDARNFLPNATKTNITMSLNYRELIHICNLRLCTRAQLEIRQLFQAIKKEVEKVDERLASLLVPSCEIHGMCFEDKCCGRKPKVNEVKGAYKLLEGDDTILSGAD